MKSIICTSLFVMVLVSAHRYAGNNEYRGDKMTSVAGFNALIKFDTFFAVRTIQSLNPPKTIAHDTIIFVMQDYPRSIPKKAGHRFSFDMIPYNPFDSAPPSKRAPKDTLILTSKPYHPPI